MEIAAEVHSVGQIDILWDDKDCRPILDMVSDAAVIRDSESLSVLD